MKKVLLSVLGICFVVCFVCTLFINSFIASAIRKQLTTIFPHSTVLVGRVTLHPFSSLAVGHFSVVKKGAYAIDVKNCAVHFSLSSLCAGQISKVYVKNISVSIATPKKPLVDFQKQLKLSSGKSAFLIASVEIDKLACDIQAKEGTLHAGVRLKVNPAQQKLDLVEATLASASMQGVEVTDGYFFLDTRVPKDGQLRIGKISYNKLKVSDVSATAHLGKDVLEFNDLKAFVLGGQLGGVARLSFAPTPVPTYVGTESGFRPPKGRRNTEAQEATAVKPWRFTAAQPYSLEINCESIDLEAVIHDFDLKEKVNLTGKLNGTIALKGSGVSFAGLSGRLATVAPGGILTIKDTSYLERMAHNTNQSLDLLVESFKNYYYNTGTVALSLEKKNIVLDVALEGKTGRRNLTVTVHDVLPKEEKE